MSEISSSNNSRIAKNTIMLYMRMIIVLLVGLYTSRVVLNTLGVVDYGIYAVVGGPVAIIGFLNVAMASSTQRYLNFELGKGDIQKLRYVFMTATYVHAFISLFVLLFAETVGLWFLLHKMSIPVERTSAAFWAYQISVCGTIISILCTPYNATIIAHEKMSAFAYISIFDVSLKLIIVFFIQVAPCDKLVLYSLLLLVVQIIMRIIYGVYCKKNFDEASYRFLWDKSLLKEMFMFAMWNLWGNMAAAFYSQGLNLLLNVFFGPKVNAARSIATTVMGQTTQFASGFQTAVNPQITKLYAQQELAAMHLLIIRSCKFSCFLLLIIAVPVFFEAPMILKLWLKTVPNYTVAFLRLSLCIAILDSMARPLMTAAAATGKIKVYQSVVGGILLLIVLVAYVVLILGGNPVSVYVVQLSIIAIAFIVRLLVIRPLINLSLWVYFKQVIFVCFLTASSSVIIPSILKSALSVNVLNSCLVVVLSLISVIASCYFIGLNNVERLYVKEQIFTEVKKLIR